MESRLEQFKESLTRSLAEPTGASASGALLAKKIVRKLGHVGGPLEECATGNPLRDCLHEAAKIAGALSGHPPTLATALLGIADALRWYKRPAVNEPVFEQGHMNAEIFGPRGLVVRNDVMVGVTLMKPGLTYPDHHHPPEEIYVVLSEGLWRQNDAPWWSPGPGGYVYNPPDILHAMKSLQTPLFAVWSLDLDSPAGA